MDILPFFIHLLILMLILSYLCVDGHANYSGTPVYINYNLRYVTDIPKMFCLLTSYYCIQHGIDNIKQTKMSLEYVYVSMYVCTCDHARIHTPIE